MLLHRSSCSFVIDLQMQNWAGSHGQPNEIALLLFGFINAVASCSTSVPRLAIPYASPDQDFETTMSLSY